MNMFTCSGRRWECNLFTISSVNFELKQGNNIDPYSFSEFPA